MFQGQVFLQSYARSFVHSVRFLPRLYAKSEVDNEVLHLEELLKQEGRETDRAGFSKDWGTRRAGTQTAASTLHRT